MPEPDAILIPSSYLAAFLDHLVDDPGERESLLAGTGIDPESLCGGPAMLPLPRVLHALRKIDGLAAPGWHIEPALSLEAAHHGPLGIAIVTAATVGQAMDNLVRFESIRAPWALVSRQHHPDRLVLRILPTVTLDPTDALLTEILLIALASIVARVVGRSDDLQVVFPERERGYQPLLEAKLELQCRFEGRHHELSLPADQLSRPCLLADPELNESALRRCEALLARATGGNRLAARIRQDLINAGGRSPGIGNMAARYNQSPRSLTRHLARDGTSYRALVEDVRRSIARDLLRHSDRPIASIANRLGYSDPANFGRAFRRWFGVSPGQVRRGEQPIDPANPEGRE